MSWCPWVWEILIQLTPTLPELEVSCTSACLSFFLQDDVLETAHVCWELWSQSVKNHWKIFHRFQWGSVSTLGRINSTASAPSLPAFENGEKKEGCEALRQDVSKRALYFSQWLGGYRNKVKRKKNLWILLFSSITSVLHMRARPWSQMITLTLPATTVQILHFLCVTCP